MPPVHSKVHRRTIHGQSREVIATTLQFMQSEADNNGFVIPVKRVQERVHAATRVSKAVIKAVKKEIENVEAGTSASYNTPRRNKNRPRPVTDLDDFDLCVVRKTIHNFYVTEKRIPTVKAVLAKLRTTIGYKGQASSLKTIFKKLGFRWKKTQCNRRILIEKPDIHNARITYLRAISKFRREGRPIVYSDETYIHSSHTTPKAWSDDSAEGLKSPISKGQRLIIVHAGSEKGFIPNALLIFKSNQTTGDYHKEMNSTNYMRWVKEMLLPNLPPRSVLVIDNASYHNVQYDKCPTSNTRKQEMQDWLVQNNIPFTEDMFKTELYELVKLHKPKAKKFILDQVLREQGHTVLRLPPYHPDLNAIEKIWGDVKQWVAQRNVSFKLSDVWELCKQRFGEIGEREWSPVCCHVHEVEKDYIKTEGLLEPEIERLTINLDSSSSSGSEDETSSIASETGELMSGVEELE